MTTSHLTHFASTDLAIGEARIYNHYTKSLIMSVDVDGCSLDAAYSLCLDAINANVVEGVACDIEIDQMPYDEAEARREQDYEAASAGYDYHSVPSGY